jgi:hypothetical protein
MLAFRSEAHVARWCAARDLPRGGMLTPEQAWRLAHDWFANKLKPDWRRHTLAEAEALFAEIGLTDEFWNLRSY